MLTCMPRNDFCGFGGLWCLLRVHTHTHAHTHTHTHTQILDHNPLGLKGVTPIVKQADANDSRLTRLSLRNTSLNVECAQQCADALKSNKQLLHLALDDNRDLSDQGVAAIAYVLTSAQLALQSLSLRNVGATNFDSIKSALRLNVSLKKIECDDDSVTNFFESSWCMQRAIARIWNRMTNNPQFVLLNLMVLAAILYFSTIVGDGDDLAKAIYMGSCLPLWVFILYVSLYK